MKVFGTYSRLNKKKKLLKARNLVELKTLREKPKCEDGRVCNHENDGFIVINCLDPKTGETGLKNFCYPCYKSAEKDKNKVLLELYGKINKVE